jgi:hypothetical protein
MRTCDHARTAGFPVPRQYRAGDARYPTAEIERPTKTIVGQLLGDTWPLRLIGNIEGSLGHAQWIEKSLLFELK